MRFPSKALGGCAATLLVAGVLLPAGSARAATTTTSTINWKACTESTESGLHCAAVQVPLDYNQPNGPQIKIAVVAHPATDPAQRKGSLFWNPGGPGGSGTQTLKAALPDFTGYEQAHFDIISFDPRGIQESDGLKCYDSPAQEQAALADVPAGLFPSNPAQERAEINAWTRFDKACATHGGPIQNHMGTADVARDMDRIRAAIGDRQITFDGTSYGTYLGVTYANLFPSRVAAMVLDGNVDPNAWNDARTGTQISTFDRLNSPLGSELGFRTFIRDCAEAGTDKCAFAAGSDVATLAKWRTLKKRLATQTVTVAGQSFDAAFLTTYTAAELESVQPSSLGMPGWAGLAQVLQAVWSGSLPGSDHHVAAPQLRGEVRPAQHSALAAAMMGTGAAVGLAADVPQGAEGTDGVLCGETPNPRDPYSYQPQAALYNRAESPDGFGSTWTWEAGACPNWQARDQDEYRGPWNRLPASKYLIIGTLADSNTAYTSSLAMAGEVGGARLLTETGGGHTSFLNQSTCVNNAIDAFVGRGQLPPVGTVCNQDEPPF
ncbi:alpha/beta fold hydrolase [Allobranchiibius huperziae]|uniref:Pimeloyl-ACP methyl ester carboxylesterase n=1 Tax=Allobranchiibius huperziae TaxID=1874116 RepID=A0A853DJM8_9MICO|nr:pimeloyl-ACP methyl ester carboxylesterase [Allobranchiibius huperziae]